MTQPLSDYVHVYTASGQLAGEMIRAFLEAQGIPAIAVQESAGQTLGLTVGPLGIVKIMVPALHLEEAEKLLEDIEEGEFEETGFVESGDQETGSHESNEGDSEQTEGEP